MLKGQQNDTENDSQGDGSPLDSNYSSTEGTEYSNIAYVHAKTKSKQTIKNCWIKIYKDDRGPQINPLTKSRTK